MATTEYLIGIMYHDPEAVLARWRRQIAAQRNPAAARAGHAEGGVA